MFATLHAIILWFLATTSSFTKGSHHLYVLRSPCVSGRCMYNPFIKYPWNLQQDSSHYSRYNLNLMQPNIRSPLPQITNQLSVETDGLPNVFLQSMNTKQYPQHYNKMVTQRSQIVPLMQQFSSTEAPYRIVDKPNHQEGDYLSYTKQQNSGYHVSNKKNQCCPIVSQPHYNQIIIRVHHSPYFSNKEHNLAKTGHKFLENKIASNETEDQKQKYDGQKYNNQTIFTSIVRENMEKNKPVNEKITDLAQLNEQYIKSTISSTNRNDNKYEEETKNNLTGRLIFNEEHTKSSVNLEHTKKDYATEDYNLKYVTKSDTSNTVTDDIVKLTTMDCKHGSDKNCSENLTFTDTAEKISTINYMKLQLLNSTDVNNSKDPLNQSTSDKLLEKSHLNYMTTLTDNETYTTFFEPDLSSTEKSVLNKFLKQITNNNFSDTDVPEQPETYIKDDSTFKTNIQSPEMSLINADYNETYQDLFQQNTYVTEETNTDVVERQINNVLDNKNFVTDQSTFNKFLNGKLSGSTDTSTVNDDRENYKVVSEKITNIIDETNLDMLDRTHGNNFLNNFDTDTSEQSTGNILLDENTTNFREISTITNIRNDTEMSNQEVTTFKTYTHELQLTSSSYSINISNDQLFSTESSISEFTVNRHENKSVILVTEKTNNTFIETTGNNTEDEVIQGEIYVTKTNTDTEKREKLDINNNKFLYEPDQGLFTMNEKIFDYLIFTNINDKGQNKDPEQTTLEDNEFDLNYMKQSELNNALFKIQLEPDEQSVAVDDELKEYYAEQLQPKTSIILNTEEADESLKINTSSEKINFESLNHLTEKSTKTANDKSKEYSAEQLVTSTDFIVSTKDSIKSQTNNSTEKINFYFFSHLTENSTEDGSDDNKSKESELSSDIIENTENPDESQKINVFSQKINFEPSNHLIENITKPDDVDVDEKSEEYSVEQSELSIKLNTNTEETPNGINISAEKINFKSLNYSSENNKYNKNFSSVEDSLKSYDGRDLNLLEHSSEVSDLLLSNNLVTTTILPENVDMASEIEHFNSHNTLMHERVLEGENINDLKTNIKLEIQKKTDSGFNMKDFLTTTISYEDVNKTNNHETNKKISDRVTTHSSDFNIITLNETVFSPEEIISPTTESSFYHLHDYITESKNETESKNNTEDMETSSVKLMTTDSLLFYKDTLIIDNKEFTKENMTPDIYNHDYNLNHSTQNFNSGEIISYNNSGTVAKLMNSRNSSKTNFDDMIVIDEKTMANYLKQNNSSVIYNSEQWSNMNSMKTENISSVKENNNDSFHKTDIEITSFSSVYGTNIPLEITSNLFITDATEQTDSSYDIYSSQIQDAELEFDFIDTVHNSTSKEHSTTFTTPIYENNESIFEQKPLLNLISSNTYPVYEAQDLSAENKTFSQIISNVSNINDEANIQSQNNTLFLQNENSTFIVYNTTTIIEKAQNEAENNTLNNSLTSEDVLTGIITINQFDIKNNSSHEIFFENSTEAVNLTNLTNYADELMMSSPNFYSFNDTHFNNETPLINKGKRNFSEKHDIQITHTFQDSLMETTFNATDYQYKLSEFSSDNSTNTKTGSLESDSDDFEKAQQKIKDEILIKTSEESDESNKLEKTYFTVNNLESLLGMPMQLIMIKDAYNESLQESGEKNLKSGGGISFIGETDKIIQKREYNIHNNHNDTEYSSYKNKFVNNNDIMFRVLTLNKLASNGSSHKESIMKNNSLPTLNNTIEHAVKTKRKSRSITPLSNDFDKLPLIFQRNGCMNCNFKSTDRHKIINLQSLKMFNNNNTNNNNNDRLINILTSILFKNRSISNGTNHIETMKNNSESVNRFLESKGVSSRSSRSTTHFISNINETKSLLPVKQKITCLNCSSNVNLRHRNMNKKLLEGFDEINKLNTKKIEESQNCTNSSIILCYLLKDIYSINSDNLNKEKNFKNVSSVDDIISFFMFNRTDYKSKNKLVENDKILNKYAKNNNYKLVYNSSKNQNDNIVGKKLIRKRRSPNLENQDTVLEKNLSYTVQLKQSERAAILALLKENSESNFQNDKFLKEDDRYSYEDYYYGDDDDDDDDIKLTHPQNDEYIEEKYDDYYDGDSILELISSNITRKYITDQHDDLSQ